MNNPEDTIPSQKTGRATEFSEKSDYQNKKEAHENFKKAAARLLNVNDWHNYAGPGSSRFV